MRQFLLFGWICITGLYGLANEPAGQAEGKKSAAVALPAMQPLPTTVPPFAYVDVGPKIPNYAAGPGRTLSQMQLPLTPAESLQHMVTPVGFRVELFADESMFAAKPIAMNWDAQGRLWVCETLDYPHELATNNRGQDRIRILTDSDGDGRADQSVIFAEQLSIPTALAFHRSGAVVQNGTETLYLKDTDGDNRADVRQVLISNWALGDTHGGVSNFRNGLDNWIWAMQGYNDSAPIINGVQQQSFRMGFFRFKLSQTDPPTVEQLEFIRSTTNNTWGLGISEEGLIFGSTANRQPSFFMPIPNRYYERVNGWAPAGLEMICDTHLFKPITNKVRQVDHHGGYTAAAGHALYTARAYPPAWWNRTAFVCGPTGKLVGVFELERVGAGFRSHNPINLLASDDEWTAPIMAEVGPDGNVWVIDWYNYIVQHNPTPQGFQTGKGNAYVTDLRDKKRGRIYRVIHESTATQAVMPNLATANDMTKLVAQLQQPTMLNRLAAQRLLVERNNLDCVPALLTLIQDQTVDEVGLNVGAIHALQTLHGLNQFADEASLACTVARSALTHPAAGVRLNALRVLPNTSATLSAIAQAKLLDDADAQVQLAALLKIADISEGTAGSWLAERLTNETLLNDPWLRDGLTTASATHATGFLIAVAQPKHLAESAQQIITRVAEHFARSKPTVVAIEKLLQALTQGNGTVTEAIVNGFIQAGSREEAIQLSASGEQALRTIYAHQNQSLRAKLIQLSWRWSSDALNNELAAMVESLATLVKDSDNPIAERLSAAKQLMEFSPKYPAATNLILDGIGPQLPIELTTGLIEAVAQSPSLTVSDRLIELAKTATPALREVIFRALLARPIFTQKWLQAIEAGQLQVTDLTIAQREALKSHPSERIRKQAVEILKATGVMIENDRSRLVTAKKQLTERTGNPELGKQVFTKNCATCHVFKGEGKIVGPNLNGMSVHPKLELLTHILDPNRSVEGNYRSYMVLTTDGEVLSGLLAAETRTTIEVIDMQGKSHPILREDIEELQPSTKSVMPEGLEQAIDDESMVHLLEYLTQHDRYIPLDLSSVANVVTTVGMFTNRDNRLERLAFADWGVKMVDEVPFELIDPQGAKVANALMLHGPLGEFPPQLTKSASIRCRMQVSKLHLLGGVAGWASQRPGQRGVSMIIRLTYANGEKEDHPLIDGQHIADYIDQFEVPKSKLAFRTGNSQVRYLQIEPRRQEVIESIEFLKPSHQSAPILLAITAEVGTSH